MACRRVRVPGRNETFMRPITRPIIRPIIRSSGDDHRWLELGLLIVSGGAILAVVGWIESALTG